jgi:hypothetical protein
MGFNKKAQRKKKKIPAKARDRRVSSLSYPPTPLLLPLLLLTACCYRCWLLLLLPPLFQHVKVMVWLVIEGLVCGGGRFVHVLD